MQGLHHDLMTVSVTCVLAQNHMLVFSQTQSRVLIEQLQNSLCSGQQQKQNERAEQNDLAPPGSSWCLCHSCALMFRESLIDPHLSFCIYLLVYCVVVKEPRMAF